MILGLNLAFSSSSVNSVLGSKSNLTLLVFFNGRLIVPLSSIRGPSESKARNCWEKGVGLAEKLRVSDEATREEGGKFSAKNY
jgi:hypothetical protein